MSLVIVDSPTRRKLPPRTKPILAVVLHTTGDTDLRKILAYYVDKEGLQPHYMIETSGRIHRITPEDHIAWHCAIKPAEAELYVRGYGAWSTYEWANEAPVDKGAEFSGYRQWRQMWREHGSPSLESPLDLVTGYHPNEVSIGIEIQAPMVAQPRGFLTGQYIALADLLKDISIRYKLPLDRSHILGHADCSPMRRCNARGPWDPPASFDYGLLWDMVGTRRLAGPGA